MRPLFTSLAACFGLYAGHAAASGIEANPWPDLSNAESYSFASNRFNFPNMVLANGLAGLGQEFNNTPPYAISSIRFLYANFYVHTVGTNKPERTPVTRTRSISPRFSSGAKRIR
jgi:hypothetical protein